LTSNKSHPYSKSRISLITASSVSSGSSIEVWCVTLQDSTEFHLINPDILGAALFWPQEKIEPLPFVCIVQTVHSEHVLQIIDVFDTSSFKISGTLRLLAQATFDDSIFKGINDIAEPVMAMGPTPYVLILCLDNIIVVAYRKYGLILAFTHTNKEKHKILLFGQENVRQYIVDASICYNKDVDVSNDKNMRRIEVILLLSDRNNPKDANIGKVFFD